MFRFSWLALVAAIVYLQIAVIHCAPIGDDKADEMKIVSAMDIEDELMRSTENPNNEPTDELPKTPDDPTDHIQVIKMDITTGDVKEIEELEKEIVQEFHLDEKSEVVQLLPCIHDHMETGSDEKPKEEIKSEIKTEMKVEDSVASKEPTSEAVKVEPNSAMKEKPAALTDEDITKIVEKISFPQTDDVTKNAEVENTKAKDSEIEPRTTTDERIDDSKTRIGRAIRKSEGRDYYILAFAPLESSVVLPSYTKLDIIPIERSSNGNFDDDYDEDEEDRLQSASDDTEEGRLISSKQLSRYIRRLMRQIRKGTRKIQRKTHFKSADEAEPTVENFLHKVYETRKEQQPVAAKNSWFSWNEN